MKQQLEALADSWHARAEAIEHNAHDRVIGRAQAFFTAADELREALLKFTAPAPKLKCEWQNSFCVLGNVWVVGHVVQDGDWHDAFISGGHFDNKSLARCETRAEARAAVELEITRQVQGWLEDK